MCRNTRTETRANTGKGTQSHAKLCTYLCIFLCTYMCIYTKMVWLGPMGGGGGERGGHFLQMHRCHPGPAWGARTHQAASPSPHPGF